MTEPATATHETYRAAIVWNANRGDLRAHTITLADQTVPGSSAPERGGDPAKSDPEQLLVAAASACNMLWFLDFARRFVQIVLRPAVAFEHEPDPDVISGLHERAHEACFVANSLNCPVQVEAR